MLSSGLLLRPTQRQRHGTAMHILHTWSCEPRDMHTPSSMLKGKKQFSTSLSRNETRTRAASMTGAPSTSYSIAPYRYTSHLIHLYIEPCLLFFYFESLGVFGVCWSTNPCRPSTPAWQWLPASQKKICQWLHLAHPKTHSKALKIGSQLPKVTLLFHELNMTWTLITAGILLCSDKNQSWA